MGANILVAGENTTHVGGVVMYVYVYMRRGVSGRQKEMDWVISVVADRMTQPMVNGDLPWPLQ